MAPTNPTLVLKHFKQYDPIIYDVLKKTDVSKWFLRPSGRQEPNDYFVALCENIIGQQLSSKAARAIIARFRDLFAPGTVTPELLITTDHTELRKVGLSNAKASYVKNVAEHVVNKSLNLKEIHTYADSEIINQLVQIKGIGPWTAEMFLLFNLKREDVFSYGDLGLIKGITKLYGIQTPNHKQITKIVSVWPPFRSYGSIALWQSVDM